MSKIVGLGACVFDTLITLGEYPKEDTKQKATGVMTSGGGPVGNALVVMASLGVNSEAIGLFAEDGAGRYLIEDFGRFGVETAHTVTVKGASSFTSYILLSEKEKTRTCVFDRGSVPDDADKIDLTPIDTADILHLDGNYLNCAIAAAKQAKKAGVKVSLDAGGLYADIDKLLPYVDILIPSAEFAKGITGKATIAEAMAELKEKYDPEVLVVTDGSNGGYFYRDGIVKYESVKVAAVDTNGAGDTFHGAFLAAYTEGKPIEECCRFASCVSAYKCTKTGLRVAFADTESLKEFLKNNNA